MTELSKLNPDELPLYELLGLLQSSAASDPAGTLAIADAALDTRGPSPWLYAVVGVCELALSVEKEDAEAARDAAREAIGLLPDDPALVLYAAPVLLGAEAEREAIAALERVGRREPYSTGIQALLAEAWLAVGERAQAAAALASLRSLDAGDPRLPELEARLAGADETTPSYVRALFDGYADRFDSDLVQTLQYITPEILAGMLEGVLEARCDLSVCDAGCGTGLMARHLRPYAGRPPGKLTGVDLSPRMLGQAAKTGLYDELVASELVSFLNEDNTVYDLIVAADVLVYIGDLAGFFMAASASLRPGGWLALSVEKDEAADDFRQLPTRRFAHSAGYLRKLCAAHGFTLEQLVEFQPRREGAGFIDGLAILARRD